MSASREAIGEFNKRIEKLLEVILENIDDPKSLSKKCEPAHIVIPQRTGQTVLRASWGILRKCHAFYKNMHNTFYPTLAKFAEVSTYFFKMFELIDKVDDILYVAMQVDPTADRIQAILQKTGADAVYVRVRNAKGENKFFYADAKQCVELKAISDYDIDTHIPYRLEAFEKPVKLSKCDFDSYVRITGYTPLVWIDKNVYMVMKAASDFLTWLKAVNLASDEKYRYAEEKGGPVIEHFRKAVHVGTIVKMIKPFLPGLSDDFSVTKYFQQDNVSEESLNTDLGAIKNSLDEYIKLYEDALAAEASSKEDKTSIAKVKLFDKNKGKEKENLSNELQENRKSFA